MQKILLSKIKELPRAEARGAGINFLSCFNPIFMFSIAAKAREFVVISHPRPEGRGNILIPLILSTLIFTGCPTTKETAKENVPPPPPRVVKKTEPAIVIKFASLDLGRNTKRIEQSDINHLADIIRKEKIDVLALQGVNRYPGVATRVDIIDGLSTQTEMRAVFGETIALSGRQSGNAIFSMYPVQSNENTHYDGLQSNGFEAALQAVVDCGVRDIVFISTELPEKGSYEDQSSCVNRLGAFGVYYINHPLIVTGNLPRSDGLRATTQLASLKPVREEDAPRVWFTADSSLTVLDQHILKTTIGPMTVAHFGIYKQK